MATDSGEQAGDTQPPVETTSRDGASSLDRLATWAVDTQDFVREFGEFNNRWSRRPPNSPTQRKTFEKALGDLVNDANGLATRLRDIGSDLPLPGGPRDREAGDQAATEAYEQLTRSGFFDAWLAMSRLLERQLAEAQEPNTAAEWRKYFRRFDSVWKGARDLGQAARAVQDLLEEQQLVRNLPQDVPGAVTGVGWERTPLEELSVACGELVAFLVGEDILRDNGRPAASSHEIASSRGSAGGLARLEPLLKRLEVYLDAVDRLIDVLREASFLRIEADLGKEGARVRKALRHLLTCARHRYEIANHVLHAVLQMADPIYVSPREALLHAWDARDVLRDLEIRNRRFGRAVAEAERRVAAGPSSGLEPRPWSGLDEAERAIVHYLREHPSCTRKDLQMAIRRFSSATLWRRLGDLESDGVVESQSGTDAGKSTGGRHAGKSSSASGKTPKGGSEPFVFRLTAIGERLYAVAPGP